jgi:hypothetical protein
MLLKIGFKIVAYYREFMAQRKKQNGSGGWI